MVAGHDKAMGRRRYASAERPRDEDSHAAIQEQKWS
jgi:hypothetical protein